MLPLAVQSIRSIKPISFASSMQRAKEGDRSQDRMAQWPSSSASPPVSADVGFAAQDAPEMPTVFPVFSTLALVQMIPPRSVPPARLQDYTAMASSNEDDADVGIGQLFDMHA